MELATPCEHNWETMAMLSDGKEDIVDKKYADFTAEMYSKGHSFFTYISDNPDGLSSCCFSGDTIVQVCDNGDDAMYCDSFESVYNRFTESNAEYVYTIDKNNGLAKAKPIKLYGRQMYRIIFANGEHIVVSDNHINCTTAGDKRTDEVVVGDVFVCVDGGNEFEVVSIEKDDYKGSIYCFQMLNEDDPYFTLPNGLVTHNCRLRNEIDSNEFSFTSGLAGVSTGSINVITINFSRFTQMLKRECDESGIEFTLDLFKERLKALLEDTYKFHFAYRQLLQENVDNDIMPIYKAGFITLKKQFSTIGLNGVNEAAMFLGMKCNDNPEYVEFCKAITTTLSEQNKLHKTKDCKFNSEFVPAEGLGVKNYNWDKADGFWVPEGRNCYTSYFYLPDDPNISVTDTFKLHGREFTENLDGGVANHVNLSDHLSFKQVRHLIKWAVKTGCSYFTFNVPNSECDECGFISKHPLKKCPHCGSEHITWWTRIIGYLKPIKNFGKAREEEASKRHYHDTTL